MMVKSRTKYTPERVEMILAAIRDGLTNKDAALVAGLHRDTIDDWSKKYPAFSAQLAQAHAERARGWLAGIAAAAPKDWKALESLLDRCAPDYRKTERHELTGKDGGPVQITGIEVPFPPGENDA